MSDPQPTLNEILEELHEALEASDDLGDEAREKLRSAAREIQQTIGDETAEPQSPLDRLNEAIESFEGKHPKLTAIVGRIADALSDLGI